MLASQSLAGGAGDGIAAGGAGLQRGVSPAVVRAGVREGLKRGMRPAEAISVVRCNCEPGVPLRLIELRYTVGNLLPCDWGLAFISE